MSFPVPAAPARTFISAADALAARSGVSVRVSPKHGLQVWAVVRTQGSRVVDVQSGIWSPSSPSRQATLYDAVREAVLRQFEAGLEEVYCDDENTAISLRALGIPASFQYPPAVAITALDEAVSVAIANRFAHLTITADSSRGKCSPWLGHGWVLDFGTESPIRLGQRATEGRSILEGELRSIRFAIQAARGTYPASMQGSTEIIVRSDSQLALRMLTEPGFEPPSSNGFCLSEAARILHYTRHASVHFEWVKGHSGDPHNTAADRLAVLARRSREAYLSFEEVQRLTVLAHQDVLSGVRRSRMALAA